ncbi:alpha/beta fold hydrolase [Amycolatopsis sp. H20-H5]|uniref:alpha/beta fold hydrolase n=1 Tax=Amycolatopsis sp. H20-H5 TaxID=3046309 RepID=UPI002DBB387D|nr:alpha/beta hydrolase [Amycolatopsis sp. H20-H5]MEC3978862.1 alpha/beta hydrolase [Amycolatopsis sp. H20-H5]
MSTFVLIHGGGSSAWDWHRLAPELRGRGHDVVAVDLPIDDPSAGLAEFTASVVDAVGDRTDLVVVAHSYGGFTGPLVCAELPVRLLVMLAAMIPAPGEKPNDWWGNTGFQGPEGLTEAETYFNGVPADVADECVAHGRAQVSAEGSQPWPLAAWPGVPTKVLIATQDNFFAPDFQRRVAKERLDVVPDEIDGGHLVALGNPAELADRLDSYLTS